MSSVEYRSVSKAFARGQTVVDAVDLEVGEKELLVIVGPSGCGKSTMLRLAAGLEPVTRGSILIDGKDVTWLSPKARDVAMVFQNYALYAHLNVRENLAFGLKARRTSAPETRRRVNDAADLLGLTPYLERKPKQLSGGQRQRVAIGRALVRQPKSFLLDEPLSNLDASLRGQMRQEIAVIHDASQTSMILVTHDQMEAMTLGHRIAVMKDGVVQQVGSPLELYDRPGNIFVAGFLGSPAMNIIEATFEISGGDAVFRCHGFSLPVSPAIGFFFQTRKRLLGTSTTDSYLLGLRPEHLRPAMPGERAFEATVTAVESTGAQTLLRLIAGATPLTSLSERRDDIVPGSTLRMAVESQRLHLFGAENGVRLPVQSERSAAATPQTFEGPNADRFETVRAI